MKKILFLFLFCAILASCNDEEKDKKILRLEDRVLQLRQDSAYQASVMDQYEARIGTITDSLMLESEKYRKSQRKHQRERERLLRLLSDIENGNLEITLSNEEEILNYIKDILNLYE